MIGEYTCHIDETDETIIDIAFNGKDIAWFLSDDITDQQVKNIVNRLNEYVKKCNRLEDDLQYYKTKSASLEEGYIALQDENNRLKHQRQEDINALGKIAMEYKAINEIFKKAYQESKHSIEATTIVKLGKKIGVDWK